MKPYFIEFEEYSLGSTTLTNQKIYIDLNYISAIRPALIGANIKGSQILLNNHKWVWVSMDYEKLKVLVNR